jgi:hypothetical protein
MAIPGQDYHVRAGRRETKLSGKWEITKASEKKWKI